MSQIFSNSGLCEHEGKVISYCPFCEIERLQAEIKQYKKVCDDWEVISKQSIALIKETQLAAIAEMKRIYPRSGCYQVLEAYFGLIEV